MMGFEIFQRLVKIISLVQMLLFTFGITKNSVVVGFTKFDSFEVRWHERLLCHFCNVFLRHNTWTCPQEVEN